MTDAQKRWAMIGGALLIVVVLLVLLFRPKEGAAPAQQPAPPARPPAANGGLTSSGTLTDSAASPAPAPPPPQSAALAVRLAAMVFAERYGSYSTSSDFANIAELAPLMTERFRRDREAFVATARVTQAGATFRAATAAAMLANVTLTDGEQSTRATAVVTTQRSVQEGNTPTRTFTQDITLDFLRVGDAWVVDGAVWGAER